MIRLAVEGCRRNGIHSGLCGQAPSDYPDMAQFLVEIGIDSMSLNPDTVLETTRAVLDVERRLGRPPRAGATTGTTAGAVTGTTAGAEGAVP
jgi:pyruvate,water dikinase